MSGKPIGPDIYAINNPSGTRNFRETPWEQRCDSDRVRGKITSFVVHRGENGEEEVVVVPKGLRIGDAAIVRHRESFICEFPCRKRGSRDVETAANNVNVRQ